MESATTTTLVPSPVPGLVPASGTAPQALRTRAQQAAPLHAVSQQIVN